MPLPRPTHRPRQQHQKQRQKHRVLFVCLGNICRSPTAQGVFTRAVAARGVQAAFDIDSAGVGAWHVGAAPDPRAQQAAARRGIDISHLRGRQLQRADGTQFDYLLAMDQQNLHDIKQLLDAHASHKVQRLLAFSQTEIRDIPDPYYGGVEGFDAVLDLLEPACEGLLSHILQTSA